MVRVDADTEMKTFLSSDLDEVLVGANASGFKGLGGQLLVLVGDKVDAEREVVYVGALATEIENADLGIRYTTVEPALGVLQPVSLPFVSSLCCFQSHVRACSCSSGSNGRDGGPL